MIQELQKIADLLVYMLNNEQCVTYRIDNAGLLTYYLETAGEKPRMRLKRPDRPETFVINNAFGLQFGFVAFDAQISNSSRNEYGGMTLINRIDYRYDMIVFINDASISFDPVEILPIFGQVSFAELTGMEINPVQVVSRHGHILPSDLKSYPPNIRAFAFTFTLKDFYEQ